MKILVLFILLTQSIFAQDTLTVVAIGEAEREQDQIAVVRGFHASLTKAQETKLNEMYDLMESDFDFYRKIFEVKKGHFTRVDSAKTKYILENNVLKFDQGYKVHFTVHDKKANKELFTINKAIDFNNIRTLGHELTHGAYKAITGKDSIFKTKILFVSDRTSSKKNMRKEIYLMDFDGARKQRITHKNGMIISPVMSPDNTKILYSILESKWTKFKEGTSVRKVQRINLYLYDLETKKTKVISSLQGINSGAVFNKEGTGIYLTLSNLKNADIYYIDLKTLQRRRITTFGASYFQNQGFIQ